MTFYIGSQEKHPIFDFDKANPSFHTTFLTEEENSIYKHISLPHILNFGSDLGCGCNFRHAVLINEEWGNSISEDEDEDERVSKQTNHLHLNRYIKSHLNNNSFVEIYGCWDGDLNTPTKSIKEINVEDLLKEDFYFKERGFYVVKNGG